MKILAAPWVVPVQGPPLERGAVLYKGATILGVGEASALKAAVPQAQFEELEECALVPSLVNCHTHLELTGLGEIPATGDFVGWLKAIIALKVGASPEAFSTAVRKGIEECLASGQSVVADVVSAEGAARTMSMGRPLRLRLGEVICASDDGALSAVERSLAILETPGDPAWGLFPHTPYTVGEAAYRLSALESVERWGRFFTHLAESAEEVEFCLTGGGPMAIKLYAGLPVRPPHAPGVHPVSHLRNLGLLDGKSVLVHAVQVGEQEIETIAGSGAPVVLCPRSNRFLGVGDAPARRFLDLRVPLGFGTDSALSAGDLDIWKDLLLSIDAYGFSPLEALHVATLGGARVLGLAPRHGALCAGSRADILAIRLGEGTGLSERLGSSPGRGGFVLGGERIF